MSRDDDDDLLDESISSGSSSEAETHPQPPRPPAPQRSSSVTRLDSDEESEDGSQDEEEEGEYRLRSAFRHGARLSANGRVSGRVQRMARELHAREHHDKEESEAGGGEQTQSSAEAAQSSISRPASSRSATRRSAGASSALASVPTSAAVAVAAARFGLSSSASPLRPRSAGSSLGFGNGAGRSFQPSSSLRAPLSPVRSSSSADMSASPSARYFAATGGSVPLPATVPSGPASTSGQLDAESLQRALARAQAQLAEREQALEKERNQRLSVQRQLASMQSAQETAPLAPAQQSQQTQQPQPQSQTSPQQSTQSSQSIGEQTSKSQFFHHLSLNSNPDLTAWSEQFQSLQREQAAKIASLTRLIEEQSAEVASMRRERTDLLHQADARIGSLTTRNAHLESMLASMEEQLDQSRASGRAQERQLDLQRHEIDALSERARSDVATLVDKLERAAHENAQLRAVVVAEKEKSRNQAAELVRLRGEMDQAQSDAESARAACVKYKTKAKALVERLRAAEQHRLAQTESARSAAARIDELQTAVSASSARLEQVLREHEQLGSEHARLRQELLGKTRELTEVYSSYARAVEAHQVAQAESAQRIASMEAAHGEEMQHHARISDIVRPLSQSLQLDLHRALADKQAEVAALQAALAEARQQVDQQRRESMEDELRVEVHTLRARVEHKTAECAELQSACERLQHQLAQVGPDPMHAYAQQQQQFQQQPSLQTQQLYAQIVELHQQVASLESCLSDRESALDGATSRLRASEEAARALREQVSLLQERVGQLQSQSAPSLEEARRSEQQRAWEQQMEEQRRKEQEWRERVREERIAFQAALESDDSFVAKAIAIHCEELTSEVDSLCALMSARQHGMEPGIEHLVPKPALHQSELTLPQVEVQMNKTVTDLRVFRRYIADEYAARLSHECITQ